MAHWYDPLLTFLTEQPAETMSVALTFAEVAVLVGGAVPSTALARAYWWDHATRSLGKRLAVLGWRVTHVRGRPPTITFERQLPDASAGLV